MSLVFDKVAHFGVPFLLPAVGSVRDGPSLKHDYILLSVRIHREYFSQMIVFASTPCLSSGFKGALSLPLKFLVPVVHKLVVPLRTACDK